MECVVIGLGFVGQTLAVHMARSGLVVYGVDISTEILETLRLGESSFFEEGMSERLRQTHGRRLTFHHKIPQRKDSSKIRCYILAVGTPIDSGRADLAALSQALSDALADSSENDLVVVRSTVPLGTCRNIVAGMIEKYGYQIGTNFFLAMAPERTVEGKALDELRRLPQLVGAFDSRSLDRAVTVFQTFSSSVIKLESLESAELSKLVCNSWRDLTFGFVNELALVCETLSVSAHELVHKCNYEYPRASLPIPSPGVGGYCLTKDPLLYAEGVRSLLCEFDLSPISEMSRMANEVAAKMPDRALKRFLKTTAKRISELGILVVGIAFKGSPETDDLRFSTAVQFLDRLKAQDLKTVSVIDALVTTEKLKYFGEVSSVDKPVDDSIDIIFILNNHPLNRVLNIEAWLGMTHARMICDPWDLFGPRRNKIEESGVSYETMGYRTVKE